MFAAGDLETAVELFEQAYAIAERVGDRDGQMLALSGKGRAFIKAGQDRAGLALLDEGRASAMCGDLRAHSTGLVYCLTISTCRDLGDSAAPRSGPRRRTAGATGSTSQGSPGRAGFTAPRCCACAATGPQPRRRRSRPARSSSTSTGASPASGHFEIGEIRRRRGDFAGAEEAYATTNELGRRRAARARSAPARAGQGGRRGRGHHATRSQDVKDPLSRVRRLPAQVEIAIAAGDLKTARAAAASSSDRRRVQDRRAPRRRVRRDRRRSPTARSQLAEKDWDGAMASLRRARDGWQGVGAPYETARARLLLGIAYRRAGDEHAADGGARRGARDVRAARGQARRGAAKELLGRLEARRTFLFTDIVDSTRLLETWATTSGSGCSRATTSSCANGSRRRRRGREEDGGRVLRLVRVPEGGDRRGGGDPARARGRDRRAGRPDRRTHRRGVPHRRRTAPTTAGRTFTSPRASARSPGPRRSSSRARRSTASARPSGSPSRVRSS